ncbi:unnamed protein product [Rotaria sp. Silwood2]|nr:unnamed protein product [Rotaria sp. Silwood2]CAF2990341.1 unnamed protein product [Rotaria sp. Silwood2]CAF3379144.1 unnamed protein product [Rotaria sp. Silwood2]CAF3869182.1 unnamed protein product [Rotaria sp. Silwood2]CAF4183894.1 unnamed protein product [Rotaria sp. Silwood2]
MREKGVIRRSKDAVQKELSSYNELYQDSTSVDKRKVQHKTLVTNYYNLTTDGHEYAWSKNFHCVNRFRGETFGESIQRHESCLALRMQLKPEDKVLDIGCGVGGSLRRIAHLTGAHATGAPANCQFIQGDFMDLPFENNSFNHVYAIESRKCFAEVIRVIKLGGSCIGYDMYLTDKYDNQNHDDNEIIHMLESSFDLPEFKLTRGLISDLKSVGITAEENRIIPEADIHSYQRLEGYDSFLSLNHFLTSPLGRWLGLNIIWLMEKTRVVSKGIAAISDMCQKSAKSGLHAGKLDIVTPMFFFLARKPEL